MKLNRDTKQMECKRILNSGFPKVVCGHSEPVGEMVHVKVIFWTQNVGAISLNGGFQTTICIAFGMNQITINQATELVEDVS